MISVTSVGGAKLHLAISRVDNARMLSAHLAVMMSGAIL